ncbi:hypothetical protein GQ55_2G262100 [Panicum hallii var. hallii]|uniref:Uncharacterized protein n=1 Tax=Panicum hallii var. hallii TaxID=1504633 RepID=A0A2T7ESG7_9POAL|nr:hypothetical protein GQ55_2G262100 [Panicum hallii var. hallii]
MEQQGNARSEALPVARMMRPTFSPSSFGPAHSCTRRARTGGENVRRPGVSVKARRPRPRRRAPGCEARPCPSPTSAAGTGALAPCSSGRRWPLVTLESSAPSARAFNADATRWRTRAPARPRPATGARRAAGLAPPVLLSTRPPACLPAGRINAGECCMQPRPPQPTLTNRPAGERLRFSASSSSSSLTSPSAARGACTCTDHGSDDDRPHLNGVRAARTARRRHRPRAPRLPVHGSRVRATVATAPSRRRRLFFLGARTLAGLCRFGN